MRQVKKLQNQTKKTLQIMWWVIKLVFGLNKNIAWILLTLQIFWSITPFIEQRFLSGLIDGLIGQMTSGSSDWLKLFGFFLITRLVRITLGEVYNLVDRIFELKTNTKLAVYYISKISQFDYQQYEDEQVISLKSKVDEEYRWRVRQMVSNILYMADRMVSLLTVVVILIPRYWYMAVILFVGEIPGILVDKKLQKTSWKTFNFHNDRMRPGWDAFSQLINKRYIAELKINKTIEWLKNKFVNTQTDYANDRTKNRLDNFLPRVLTNIFSILVGGGCMLLVIKDIRLGLLSVGMFTFYFNIIRSTGDYFANVLNTFVSIGEQSLYIDNFKTLVELPNIIKPGKIKKVNKLPKIEFVKVWFKYPGSTKYVFKNLNLVIEKGEEIAIVGHNGAGKSTLIKLLCRFYDPNKGQILIDGVDLKKLDINSWYDKLSLLTQEFNTYENLDLKENVAIGNKINKKRIITSLKRSDAWEFVGNYKNGLDTMMSQRYGGAEPSWGQWQKIAIARLFYSNKDIMVLDEPTSSIDAISEAKIFNRLYKQVSGKTLIIVSHRFSTVRNAKRIIVLNKGEIVEIGSHEELVKLNGYYNKSFNLQAKGYK